MGTINLLFVVQIMIPVVLMILTGISGIIFFSDYLGLLLRYKSAKCRLSIWAIYIELSSFQKDHQLLNFFFSEKIENMKNQILRDNEQYLSLLTKKRNIPEVYSFNFPREVKVLRKEETVHLV